MPLVKNKGGDLTDVDNYRAIALSNVETKVLEIIILQKFTETAECDMYQFDIKRATLLACVGLLLLLNGLLNII